MNTTQDFQEQSNNFRPKHKSFTVAEKVFIGGPWLVGWLYGVLHFKPHEIEFKISFFSFLLFAAYLLLLGLVELFGLFFLSPSNIFIAHSFCCLLYLLLGLYSLIATFRDQSNATLVRRLVDKLFID